MLRLYAWLSLVLVGCSSVTTTPNESEPQDERPVAIFVANEEGLALLDASGQTVSTVPTSVFEAGSYSLVHPSGETVYVLSENTVWEVPLDSPADFRQAAIIPMIESNYFAGPAASFLQETSDWRVSEDGSSFCISLLDVNANMMNEKVDVLVVLPDGTATTALVFSVEGSEVEPSPCADQTFQIPRWPRSASARIELDETTCTMSVVQTGQVVDLGSDEGGCADWSPDPEGASTSGRYLAISEFSGAGDYFYRDLHIVDLHRAQLVPELIRTVVGESRVEWAPIDDALLVDDELWVLGTEPHQITLSYSAVWLR